ncbi:acyl-CoA transferase [Pseudomaricurvus alkylphenolicus]|uniref:acyl-CoA transferase n=1 Tax=Pseudomaricurvus alkylphenolicus TaxID=1306991 RepID=UPI00142263E8|nr:acyl-CoA transferase [Pseudomaricurvus alkylphenolicus]NIB39023.1 acyl-CoA transferase [Pseudomaricurvus alkylphenolicus]
MRLITLFTLWLCLLGSSVLATEGEDAIELPVAPGYLARIELNTPQELLQALKRAETLFMEGRFQGMLPPATLVVHGPEVAVFFRQSYLENRELVDLAAKLSAFRVVDIRVCETRMGVLGRDRSELYPFISTVPFGPDEVNRLIDELDYVYF